jgi:hypothetical protein
MLRHFRPQGSLSGTLGGFRIEGLLTGACTSKQIREENPSEKLLIEVLEYRLPWVGAPSRVLVSALACHNCGGCLQKDFYVQPDGPDAGIFQVQSDHFVEARTAASFYLPKTSNPRFDL